MSDPVPDLSVVDLRPEGTKALHKFILVSAVLCVGLLEVELLCNTLQQQQSSSDSLVRSVQQHPHKSLDPLARRIAPCQDIIRMDVALLLWTAWVGAAATLVWPWLWDNVVVIGRRLWATRHIPEPPGSFFLGHIPTLVASRYKSFRCFAEWSLKWPVYRVRFFFRPVRGYWTPAPPQPRHCTVYAPHMQPHNLFAPALHTLQVLIVTDPDVYGPLMRQGQNRLPKYTAPYRMFEVFTNPERANILTSPENAEWKAVRRAAVAALTMSNLRCVLQCFLLRPLPPLMPWTTL